MARLREALGEQLSRFRLRAGMRLIGPHAQLTFAQEGEDRILARLLERNPVGFYVDVGSHDPRRFSNTYLLYLAGWHGIVIDPALATAKAFSRFRHRDIVLNVAIGSRPGEAHYYEFDESAINTLSAERADYLVKNTNYRLVNKRVVAVSRLDDLLDEHLPAGTIVDVLSVDVEGLDEDVLMSNDWGRYRPRIVLAEDLQLESAEALESSPITELLRSHGYHPIAKAVNSVVFVAKEPSGDIGQAAPAWSAGPERDIRELLTCQRLPW